MNGDAMEVLTGCLVIVLAERLGIHLQVDQLLLDSPDGGGVLSQILQLFVHELVIVVAVEDREAVVELRGHFDELSGVACDAETTDKGDPAEGVQGPGQWSVFVERPGSLYPAPELSQHVCSCFRVSGRKWNSFGNFSSNCDFLLQLHATFAVQLEARPGSVQGSGVESAQEVPSNRNGGWQLAPTVNH